jgi:hypothetical protein
MAKFSSDKIIVIFTVISAALLQLIDTSIVNVSLTQMMGEIWVLLLKRLVGLLQDMLFQM